jgi:hypothetical protein
MDTFLTTTLFSAFLELKQQVLSFVTGLDLLEVAVMVIFGLLFLGWCVLMIGVALGLIIHDGTYIERTWEEEWEEETNANIYTDSRFYYDPRNIHYD